MKKILIIEDDKKIRRLLQLELEHEKYEVVLANDGEDGLKKFNTFNFDLILLDLMLPKLSGEEICKTIRNTSNIPIIILTAKGNTKNKVELLDMGANDYITKPFDIEELFARIRAVSRINNLEFYSNSLKYKELELDKNSNLLIINQKKIPLTKTEYNLLEFFIINKELLLSRTKILEEVWGIDYDGDEKIVDVYINLLRKKIEICNKKYIQTIRGFGYILKN